MTSLEFVGTMVFVGFIVGTEVLAGTAAGIFVG